MFGKQQRPSGDKFRFWKGLYGTPPDIHPVRYSDGSWADNPNNTRFPNAIYYLNYGGAETDNRTQIQSDLSLEQKLDFLTTGLKISGRISFDNYFNTEGRNVVDNGLTRKYIDPRIFGTPAADSSLYIIYSYPSGNTNGYDFFDLPLIYQNEISVVGGQKRVLYYQGALNYARNFNKHEISGLVLMQRRESATGAGFLNKTEDWIGRLTYNYGSRYLFETNAAYNGSAKFSSKYRFGFFPSAAVGYVLSNETFFKNKVKFVDLLKFKYSIGKTGNDVGPQLFEYIGNLNPQGSQVNFGSPFLVPSGFPINLEGNVPNPELHWEEALKQNFGLETSFLNNKLNINFDYFWNHHTGIFVSKTQRTKNDIFGTDLPSSNLGETKVHGYELDLSYNHIFNKNFIANIRYSQAFAKDQVINRDDPQLRQFYRKDAGYQIGQTRSYINQGIIQSWDQIYTGVLGLDNRQRLPGDFRQVDYNADGIVNEEDIVPFGFPQRPQYNHSLNLGASYKGLSASVLFYGVWNVNKTVPYTEFGEYYTITRDFHMNESFWPEMNRTNTANYSALRIITGSNRGNYWVEDASFVRLKSAEIAYSFNKKFIDKLKLSRLQLYVRGNNLALWTKMREDREAENTSGRDYPY